MKTKQKAALVIITAVIAAIAALSVWYLLPSSFLGKAEPSDVKSIYVFDGNTGKSFHISDPDEIRYIVENIQGSKMEKYSISIGYSGYRFRMRFYDGAGKEIESFIINSVNMIRKDPFFYRCDNDLCYDYLEELEDTYSK